MEASESPDKAEAASEPLQGAQTSESQIGEGVRRSIADQRTGKDSLGFGPYVQAVAEFLTNPDTEPPLTLSIEGTWGSGKSSFMTQVSDQLRAAFIEREGISNEDSRKSRIWSWLKRTFWGSGDRVVWFNAWRHDRVESLHSAFALEFIREIRKQTKPLRRLYAHWLLWVRRFDFKDGGIFDLIRVAAIWVLFLSATCLAATRGVPALTKLLKENGEKGSPQTEIAAGTTPSSHQEKSSGDTHKDRTHRTGFTGLVAKIGSWTTFTIAFLAVLEWVKKTTDPIKADLKKRGKQPDYETQIVFVEQFHRDFRRILEAYLGSRPVCHSKSSQSGPQQSRQTSPRAYVFVDDLDRCEIPKAADLMQGLNLMIDDSPQIIFVLGIDRQRVAAALAVKYEKVLPYFASSDTGPSGNQTIDPNTGLEFGYGFIEKFVQVAFQVPRAKGQQFSEFLQRLQRPQSSESLRPTQLPFEEAPIEIREDTPEVSSIAEAAAPFLDYNPRRMKQFLNVFRLRRFIAYHTGLLANSPKAHGSLTLQQLGKFVLITLRWPALLLDLLIDPKLLADLQQAAWLLHADDRSPEMPAKLAQDLRIKQPEDFKRRLNRWLAREQLMRFLIVNCVPPTRAKEWAMSSVEDIEKLLHVSPLTVPIIRPRTQTGVGTSFGSSEEMAST